MKTVRRAVKSKNWFAFPGVAFKIGVVIIKTQTELILKSHWVIPEKRLEAEYSSKYPIQIRLKNIFGND